MKCDSATTVKLLIRNFFGRDNLSMAESHMPPMTELHVV